MFNLFGKKDEGIKVEDIIWVSSAGKWNGLAEIWKQDPQTIFIFWFEESLQQAQQFLFEKQLPDIEIATVRETHYNHIQNKPIVFAEHFPLRKKEQEIFQSLHVSEAKVLSALDEPIFKKFGADKIIQMLRQLGMNENESIRHSMISSAIKNAQIKIEGENILDHTAQSQAEWLNRNLPA